MPLSNRDRRVPAATLRKAAYRLEKIGTAQEHRRGKGTQEAVAARTERLLYSKVAKTLIEWADKLWRR